MNFKITFLALSIFAQTSHSTAPTLKDVVITPYDQKTDEHNVRQLIYAEFTKEEGTSFNLDEMMNGLNTGIDDKGNELNTHVVKISDRAVAVMLTGKFSDIKGINHKIVTLISPNEQAEQQLIQKAVHDLQRDEKSSAISYFIFNERLVTEEYKQFFNNLGFKYADHYYLRTYDWFDESRIRSLLEDGSPFSEQEKDKIRHEFNKWINRAQ